MNLIAQFCGAAVPAAPVPAGCRHHNLRPLIAAALAGLLMFAPAARACSLCGGQSDSNLVDGAISGVIVMAGITYALLGGIGAFIVFWMVRARRLRNAAAAAAAVASA